MTSHPADDNFDFLNKAESLTDSEMKVGRSADGLSEAADDEDTLQKHLTVENSNDLADDARVTRHTAATSGVVAESAKSLTRRRESVPRQWFIIVVSYASALTLFVGGGFATGLLSFESQSSRLESLPDVRPLAEHEVRTVSQHSTLPDGHTLRLGETRRYGDVSVTPLRVTQEPIAFTHFRRGDAFVRDPTLPVLKLWLQFRNESDNLAFPPFDVGLMTYRHRRQKPDNMAPASSLLFNSDAPDQYVLNYDHPAAGEWLLDRQASSEVLEPGESLETFVASAEGTHDELLGQPTELVWRIQFRKGVHLENRTGITTLVDVRFTPDDIGVDPEIERAEEDAS